MERRKFVWNGLVFTASLGLIGCQHEYREEPYGRRARGYGPPPHAPAHGYRHRYRRGVDLVFDSGLGVYLVAGVDRTYFYDGRFYRFRRGHWEESRDYDGNWRRSSGRRLPPGLHRRADRWRRRRGRPPRGPRHGYRYSYARGVDLVFDSGLGVYLVVGTPFYYYGDRFYRYHDGHWESRADHRGRWRRASDRDLPRALRRKHRRRRDDDDDRGRPRDRERRDRY